MIKIFCFQKDEHDILEDWIIYHKYLFGEENIHIIDHSSTDGSLDIIKNHNVNYRVFDGPFHEKWKELSKWMQENKNKCDFLVPLDADEFIVFNEGNKFSSDRGCILSEFVVLFKEYENRTRFKFKQYDAIPKMKVSIGTEELTQFKLNGVSGHAFQQSKTFYPSKTFKFTDQGNHSGKLVFEDKRFIRANLALLHYRFRGYGHFIKKNTRWKESYGKHKPHMGKPWKIMYDKIKAGEEEALSAFSEFMTRYDTRSLNEILSVKEKMKTLRIDALE